MKVYTRKNCHQCTHLKDVLKLHKIDFEEVNDERQLFKIGSLHFIMSAPIVEDDDGKVYSYNDYLDKLNLKLNK